MFFLWTAAKYGYLGIATIKSTYETSLWAYKLGNRAYKYSPFSRLKLETKKISESKDQCIVKKSHFDKKK